MRWMIMIVLLLGGAWLSFQSMQIDPTETYVTPLELKLYACIENGCEIIMLIPEGTILPVHQTITTDRNHIWKQVTYQEQVGYIGKWERNQYAFEYVRECAGNDCAIIDTVDETTMMLFAAFEVREVVQSWTLIIYDDNKIGYVGPKIPGASKKQQMTSAATQTAEAQSP